MKKSTKTMAMLTLATCIACTMSYAGAADVEDTQSNIMILCSDGVLFGEASVTATGDAAYDASVLDALVIDAWESQALVTITESDPLTTWNEDGQVLMVTWHRYPDSYVAGEPSTLYYGESWTFTEDEMIAWFAENGDDVTDYELRFEQLIGLPATTSNTHFTAFWVNPDDMNRPAYNADITSDVVELTYYDGMSQAHIDWMDANSASSYYSAYPYPWTRLGYTYDWADNGTAYGLSEFIVQQGATVDVEYTLSTEEFIAYLQEVATL